MTKRNMRSFKLMVALAALLALSSCEVETSGNGSLDGFWHMERVDTLETGGVNNLSQDYFFWAFQHKLLSVSHKKWEHPEVLFRFSHQADSLFVSNPIISDRMIGDKVVDSDSLFVIAPYGINAQEERFRVETLNSSRMVLNNGKLRLSFKKF
jgi:hypothetical protein